MLLASGARDASVCVWALGERRCTLRLTGHKAAVSGCAWLNESTLVSCSLDRTLRVYDIASGGRSVRTLSEHDQAVTSVISLDSLGNTLASASSDASLRVWDLRSDRPCVQTLFDHEAAVYGVIAMREDPDTIISCSWDRTVKIWSLRMPPASNSHQARRAAARIKREGGGSDRCLRTLRGHTDAVRALVQLDENHVASAGWDQSIRIWDIAAEIKRGEAEDDVDPDEIVSSSDGSSSAAPVVDSSVGMITGHTGWIYTLGYLPSQQLIVSGSGDKTLRLSSPVTGQTHSVLTGHENTIWGVAVLPSSAASAASASAAAAASSSGSAVAAPSPSSGSSGGLFVSCGADAQIRLWDTVGRNCTRISGGHAADAAVHALDVWPPLRDDPATRKKLVFPTRRKAAQATVTTNTAAASSSSSGSNDVSLSAHDRAALEFEAALTEQIHRSELEAARAARIEDLPHSARNDPELHRAVPGLLGIFPDVGDASSSSSVDASGAPLPHQLHSFIETETHAKPPAHLGSSVLGRGTAGISSSFTVAQAGFSSPVETPKASAGEQTSSAPACEAPGLVAELARLRAEAVRCYDESSFAAAEKHLLEMIELVEGVQESSSSSSPSASPSSSLAFPPSTASSPRRPLSHTQTSSMLFHLYHDLSLCAFKQGAFPAALRYATLSLGFFSEDDDDGEASSSDDASAANQKASPSERAATDALRELLDVRREPTDDVANMVPSVLALRDMQLPKESNDVSASSSATGSTVSASSLFFPLQLRRFLSAFYSRDLALSKSLCLDFLSRLEDPSQARETMLDEIECAVTEGRASRRGELPLHSLFAHLLALWHEEILVAYALNQMRTAVEAKEEGNKLFSAAVASAAASAGDKEANFGAAASAYARGAAACVALEDTLSSSASCPSFAWFEVAAAQLPSSSSPPHPAAAGSFLLSQEHPEPFSIHACHFLHATLASNFAQASLKCSPEQYASCKFPSGGPIRTARERRARRAGFDSVPFGGAASADSGVERFLAAQTACEAGLEMMEPLARALVQLRATIAAAMRSPASTAAHARRSAAVHDEQGERNVYVENLALGQSLPSATACNALSSKLYFRHASAILAQGQVEGSSGAGGKEDLAEASFALALQLAPEREKTRKEIDMKRREAKRAREAREKEALKLKQQQAQQQAQTQQTSNPKQEEEKEQSPDTVD